MHYQSDCRTYIKRDWEEAQGGKLVLHSGWEKVLDNVLRFAACVHVLWHLGHHGEFKEDECKIADTYTILQRNMRSSFTTLIMVNIQCGCTQTEGAHKMDATRIVQIHNTQVEQVSSNTHCCSSMWNVIRQVSIEVRSSVQILGPQLPRILKKMYPRMLNICLLHTPHSKKNKETNGKECILPGHCPGQWLSRCQHPCHRWGTRQTSHRGEVECWT